MAGWGVEEASARHKAEASKSLPPNPSVHQNRVDLGSFCRFGNAAGTGLCNPQDLHLHSRSADGRHHAQGRQEAPVVGLGHWQAEK